MTEYSGYRHYAGLKGTKVHHVGHDASAYCYTDIASAVAAAQANDTIVLHPGTHTLTAMLEITKPLRFVGIAHPKVTCSSAVTGNMIDVDLAAQGSASVVTFENIEFQHGTDDVDVFEIDNSAIAQTLTVVFKDCDIKVYDSSSTGNAIDQNQTTAGKIIHLQILGTRANQVDCVDVVPGNASNTYIFQGVYMTENGNASAIISSNAANAAIFRLYSVAFKTATKGTSGGAAQQTIVAMNCLTESVGAKLVTGDLAGSHTETLIAP